MTNDDKMNDLLESAVPDLYYIKQIMESNKIEYQDVMRALYLIANVKKLCEWGRVGFTIKRGEVINVWQEQQFISEKELKK